MAKILKNKRNIFLLSALFFVLVVGILDSYKLYSLDVELWGAKRETPSFCNVNDFVNCDAVSMSEYSTLFEIPLSLYGIVFYSAFILLTLFALFSKQKKQDFLLRFIYLFGILSSVEGVVMGSFSVFAVRAFCILCCISYIVNFAIMGLCWAILGINPLKFLINFFKDFFRLFAYLFASAKNKRVSAVKTLVFYIGFALFVLGGLKYGFSSYNSKTKVLEFTEEKILNKYFFKLPKVDYRFSKSSTSWGNPEAKVKIIEFSDFQCPFCKRAAFLLKNLVKQYESDVELIFKNYPMDSACNPSVTKKFHPKACLLAKSLLCADESDKLWRFHDFLFANSKRIKRSQILEFARNENIDGKKFDKCIDSSKIESVLQDEMREAREVGLEATPTMIIGGRKVVGLLPPRVMQIIIKHEIDKNKRQDSIKANIIE